MCVRPAVLADCGVGDKLNQIELELIADPSNDGELVLFNGMEFYDAFQGTGPCLRLGNCRRYPALRLDTGICCSSTDWKCSYRYTRGALSEPKASSGSW